MLLIATFTAPDAFGGTGLFASHFIQAGTVLWAFHPAVDVFFSLDAYKALPQAERQQMDKHVYPALRNGVEGVMYSRDNDRFTNHSFHPNTVEINQGSTQPGRYDTAASLVVAAHAIDKGEEITANYHHFLPHALDPFYYTLPSMAFLPNLATPAASQALHFTPRMANQKN